MTNVLQLAAAALLLSVTALAAPPAQPDALSDLQAATDARIAVIDALPAPTKHEKAERKWLGKAGDALARYEGVNDKADLKKGLAKATSCLRRSKCADPVVIMQLPVLQETFVGIADPAHAEASAKLAQLSKSKHVKTVSHLIAQADKKRAKAEAKWVSRMDKGATLYVAAILKLQKAITKARKYGAVDTEPVDIDSSALTLVLDPAGRPVANALVGGSQFTDQNGVAVGAVSVSGAGWVDVRAAGFATGFADAMATVDDSSFYAARVTPYSGQVPLDAGETELLQTGDDDGAWAEVTVSATSLASLPATVGVTEIDPLDVGPLFAPVTGYGDHWLRMAFGLDAWAADGSPIALVSGTLDLVLRDEGDLSDAPVLAWFDAGSGTWTPIAGACSRADDTHMTCAIPRFAALFGLFEPGAIPYGTVSKTAEEADRSFRLALAQLGAEIRVVLDAGGLPAQDQTVIGALNALAAAARESADVSPRETAKFHLLTAAGHARDLAQTALADALTAEALELAEVFATTFLDGDPCEDGPQMTAAIAQLDALGGSASLMSNLSARLQAATCDERWAGTITILMPPDKQHPGLSDFVAFVPSPWRETYWVEFTVDTKSNSLRGTCTSNIMMGTVMYLDETAECLNYIRFKGAPPFGQVEMEFTGTFDGSTFSIGPLSQAGGTTVSISQRQHFEAKDDDQCDVVVDVEYPFPNHAGFLSHGMYQPSPMISLDELLNSGARTGNDGRVSTSSGNTEFANPLPETGKYPFSIADVTWSFTRVD